jgi:hypothetical protein
VDKDGLVMTYPGCSSGSIKRLGRASL